MAPLRRRKTVAGVVHAALTPEHPSLVLNNRAFHRLLIHGVRVEFTNAAGEKEVDHAQLIDFQHPERNDFLVVNQFTVSGTKKPRASGSAPNNRHSPNSGARAGENPIMKTIPGNLIHLAQNGEFDLIVHGCNCFCTMGAGIAKGIKAAFPQAYEADLATPRGDRAKLGTCTFAVIERNGAPLIVVNAYTQFDYRGSGPKVDYDAVRSCMRWIKKHYAGKRIGLPKIGAGLAGGDWATIAAIVEEELGREDVTLVEFTP